MSTASGVAPLQRNAVGLLPTLFQSITHMAPAAAVAFSIIVGVPYAGGSIPLAVLLALVACLLVAISIGQLARHLPSAGGLYTFSSRGLGTAVGFLVAWGFMMAEPIVALSYLGLRKGIGIIGITLPFVLAVGKILFESPGLLGSISAYYYSVMRDVLVGGLCAIAVFLISYRYRRLDDLAGDLAGVSAIGIALFPGTPDVGATEHQIMIGRIHLVFTACFFLTLAFFTLVLFRKTDSTQRPTHQKLQRNRIYLFSGIVMVACIALMLLDLILPSNPGIQSLDPGFWLESLAIFAFGIAWFIKGETILKDG